MAPTRNSRARDANGRFLKQNHASDHPRAVAHLALLTLAIIVGVTGFAFHVLWLAALILMSILWGSLAEERKRQSGSSKGVVAEVVETVVEQAREVADSASPGPTSHQSGQ